MKIIQKFSYCFKKNSINLIFGPSGAGKSTLLNIIGTLINPLKGKIHLFGKELNEDNKYELRRKIGFIFQKPIFVEDLTVLENIEFYAKLNKLKVNEAVEYGLKLLVKFNLDEFTNQVPSLMSGGQRQRVAIILPLIKHPELILADEPMGSIDHKNKEIILKTLRSLKDETTLIIVSHDLSIKEICDDSIEITR